MYIYITTTAETTSATLQQRQQHPQQLIQQLNNISSRSRSSSSSSCIKQQHKKQQIMSSITHDKHHTQTQQQQHNHQQSHYSHSQPNKNTTTQHHQQRTTTTQHTQQPQRPNLRQCLGSGNSSSSSGSSSGALSSSKLIALLALLATLVVNQQQLSTALAKPLHHRQLKFRRVPPKQIPAPMSSSVIIECEASASPQPTIRWLKNGVPISHNTGFENQIEENQLNELNGERLGLSASRSRLFIDCADLSDEATYTCVAENYYSRISTDTEFTIIKPIVNTNTNNNVDNDIQDYSLDDITPASASASSSTEQQTQDTTTTTTTSSVSSSSASNTTPLPTTTTATNSAAPSNNQQSRNLAAVPQCKKKSIEPARISMWSHNLVELVNNNVVLYCRSNKAPFMSSRQSQNVYQSIAKEIMRALGSDNNDGDDVTSGAGAANKAAYISWSLPNGREVSMHDELKYEILNTGDLLIKNLQWPDMGSYVCTVSDDDNTDSVSTFVYPTTLKALTPQNTFASQQIST